MAPAEIEEPLPHVYGGSQVTTVVAFGDGLLAFGHVNGGCCDAGFSTDTRGIVWSSTDGREWVVVPTGPEFALGNIHAAAASSDRIVLVGARRLQSPVEAGSVEERGATWTSDDGVTWTRTDGVAVLGTVMRVTDGFVAASATKAFPELWWSGDGEAWTVIADQEALGNGRIERLLATPDGFFAVGSAVNQDVAGVVGGPLGPPAAVWRSTDGRSWARLEQSAAFAGAQMRDVAWSEGRLLAVGWGGDVGAVWATPARDEMWERVPFPIPQNSIVTPSTVTGLEHGFAIAGGSSSAADESGVGRAVWLTLDGVTWEQSVEPGEQEINAWLATPAGAVAVGWGCRAGVECPVPLAWTLLSVP